MDRIVNYREIIKRIIQEYKDFLPGYSVVKAETIFDDNTSNYFLFYSGWDGKDRVHGNAIHINLIGDKVWVEHDGTDQGVVDDLIAAGIPEKDIVLGFQYPEHRKYTEFAVA